jgi:hypothetical protein
MGYSLLINNKIKPIIMRLHKTYGTSITILLTASISLLWAFSAFCQTPNPPSPPPPSNKLALENATMSEDIQNFNPVGSAVAFSIKRGKVFCYTSFDTVPENTFIYHSWFRREELITTIRLTLKPPRWSTYSSIQLREADKGPWRVEIYNRQGEIMQTLRFSITD